MTWVKQMCIRDRSKTMQFKKFFFSTLIGTFISGVIGVIMAFLGFGVWALVFQYLSNVIIDTIVLWFTVKWRPILYFSCLLYTSRCV